MMISAHYMVSYCIGQRRFTVWLEREEQALALYNTLLTGSAECVELREANGRLVCEAA